jgi:hypothetical protein
MGSKKAKCLLTIAPETRSKPRRVTRSSTATTLGKKKCGTESVAVAKMPPKRKWKKPVKVAKKRRVAKGKRACWLEEGGKNRREGLCPVCREPGWHGDMCENCDSEALCVISIVESVPSDRFSSD